MARQRNAVQGKAANSAPINKIAAWNATCSSCVMVLTAVVPPATIPTAEHPVPHSCWKRFDAITPRLMCARAAAVPLGHPF
jgi:hypothetical protein